MCGESQNDVSTTACLRTQYKKNYQYLRSNYSSDVFALLKLFGPVIHLKQKINSYHSGQTVINAFRNSVALKRVSQEKNQKGKKLSLRTF
jgi:hypothetical protein